MQVLPQGLLRMPRWNSSRRKILPSVSRHPHPMRARGLRFLAAHDPDARSFQRTLSDLLELYVSDVKVEARHQEHEREAH